MLQQRISNRKLLNLSISIDNAITKSNKEVISNNNDNNQEEILDDTSKKFHST